MWNMAECLVGEVVERWRRRDESVAVHSAAPLRMAPISKCLAVMSSFGKVDASPIVGSVSVRVRMYAMNHTHTCTSGKRAQRSRKKKNN